MPELLLELFSEEIPARMQARAADELVRAVQTALKALGPTGLRSFAGPRRIAVACGVEAGTAETVQSERGPRIGAPEQALAGFLRKHAAQRDELREENGFFVLHRTLPGQTAAALIARDIPGLLWKFPWPKSMRWGGTSAFTWIRPLRRILCILDGETIPFDLRQGDDDGHGLRADNLTEGHRFLSPGAFAVGSAAEWESGLRARHVIVDADERRRLIAEGVAAQAAAENLSVVPDEGLLAEVAGLVEWPVPLIGRIDLAYMDLPAEVMQVSMRVNQRYFALRDASGNAAPYFAFVANIEADDGGAAIVAGNERVLRARFSDARHFWDLDRRTKLEDRVPALDRVTFHAKLGSQGDRARRLEKLAGEIAPLVGANVAQAQRAGLLAKADLTTGMVGEFPELQGIMGGYYAWRDGGDNNEDRVVAAAIRDHYAPGGSGDAVPVAPVSIAVALADKLDQLVQFFAAGERPTSSGDPFALRRAALGVVRILEENGHAHNLNPPLSKLLKLAGAGPELNELVAFLKERLRVKWRSEGRRHDILAACFSDAEDRIDDLRRRVEAVSDLIDQETGKNLLAGYRRAFNILRIENAKDGPHVGAIETVLLADDADHNLNQRLGVVRQSSAQSMSQRFYDTAVRHMALLREPLDAFFGNVTVNSPQPELRRNRLRLLASVVETMNRVADFSKIEG